MVYKFLSSKHAIRKVFRIFKLTPNSEWVGDAVEWIGEAIQLIGSSPLEPMFMDVAIVNHKAMFPSDFFSLDAVEYNGRALSYSGALNIFSGASDTAAPSVRAGFEGFSYIPNGIITHIPSGVVRFHYKKFPIDDEGFPLVPDHQDFLEAIQWWLIRCIILSGTPHPTIDFKMADSLWVRYCSKAQNAGFPDIPKMEAFKDNFLRIIPRVNMYSDFFLQSGNKEMT